MTKQKFLEDRKVILRPVTKPGGMNPAGHDGEFMYSGTEVHFILPYNIRKGRLETILNKEEERFFEDLLDENLSIHAKKDNFWNTFAVKVRKDDKLMSHGIEFDLSDPIDNLRWRLLKLQKYVAPSWKERFNRGEYQFALVDADEIVESKARMADKRKEAYMFLGKIDGSTAKMRNFLRVYGQNPSENAKSDFLKAEIDKLIDNKTTINDVLSIINDEDYDMKLFIEDAVDCGAMLKKERKYFLQGGDAINENDPSLKGTVDQMNIYKRDTDDIYLRIDTQIKNVKK